MTKVAKPLLFLLQKQSGTVGDQKPFCILAALAASVAVHPVTLFCNGFESQPRFMKAIIRFATYLMDDDAKKQLVIKYDRTKQDDDNFWDDVYDRYCVFDNFDCDFGASVERSKNRFKTTLFPYRAKLLATGDWTMVPVHTTHFFGPVMLPIEDEELFWSKPKIIQTLKKFREKHDKIIAVAGSLSSPYPLGDIITWMNDSDANSQGWACVVLDPFAQHESTRNVLFLKYVEFEDLVRFVDAFIGNCGAGSTMTAMATGLVQTCQIANSVGADKKFNQKVIKKLGPIHDEFHQVMESLEQNFMYYHKHAQKIKYHIRNEMEQMIGNMQKFFYELSSSRELQKQFSATRRIPTEFALEKL